MRFHEQLGLNGGSLAAVPTLASLCRHTRTVLRHRGPQLAAPGATVTWAETEDEAHHSPGANLTVGTANRCRSRSVFYYFALTLALLFCWLDPASAQSTNVEAGFVPFSINFNAGSQPQDLDMGLKILFSITLLTLAPSILLLMTCFTRIVIVLSFIRTALSLQGSPSNQIIIGLSLFMTFFVMAPVWDNINRDAVTPYQAKAITSVEALDRASVHIRAFMLKQARPKDVELFASMAKLQPTRPEELPLKVVIPGFIISELRTAFQMGFLLFVPFILIDLVVATVLMSMGMMMMPPMTFSLPLKILLFVLVDGWELVVRSLIRSFGM
ncbi:MAG: flagellar type III secretion system pore protein FliP [Verrucomicrobia bacterium]|nr:flagellar type III secretion system pore protein FliP [Verrucomicrobiota bacterium]